MSGVAVALFTWLQDADFYRDMHAAAVALLPAGAGRRWLDVGCGPGLLAREAAARGYRVRAIDRDAGMIARAKRLALKHGAPVEFVIEDLHRERRERFDIVSASSLLVVTPDPSAALRGLVALTNPGGSVLVIEASARMSLRAALSYLRSGRRGRHALMLLLWALARSGSPLPASVFDQPGLRANRHALLNGMADAWIVERGDG